MSNYYQGNMTNMNMANMKPKHKKKLLLLLFVVVLLISGGCVYYFFIYDNGSSPTPSPSPSLGPGKGPGKGPGSGPGKGPPKSKNCNIPNKQPNIDSGNCVSCGKVVTQDAFGVTIDKTKYCNDKNGVGCCKSTKSAPMCNKCDLTTGKSLCSTVGKPGKIFNCNTKTFDDLCYNTTTGNNASAKEYITDSCSTPSTGTCTVLNEVKCDKCTPYNYPNVNADSDSLLNQNSSPTTPSPPHPWLPPRIPDEWFTSKWKSAYFSKYMKTINVNLPVGEKYNNLCAPRCLGGIVTKKSEKSDKSDKYIGSPLNIVRASDLVKENTKVRPKSLIVGDRDINICPVISDNPANVNICSKFMDKKLNLCGNSNPMYQSNEGGEPNDPSQTGNCTSKPAKYAGTNGTTKTFAKIGVSLLYNPKPGLSGQQCVGNSMSPDGTTYSPDPGENKSPPPP